MKTLALAMLALVVSTSSCDSRHDGWIDGHVVQGGGGPSGVQGFGGGIVEVREGSPRRVPLPDGSTHTIMPPHIVTVQNTVDIGGFNFRLPAGHYTLVLRGGFLCFTEVTVITGETINADVACSGMK